MTLFNLTLVYISLTTTVFQLLVRINNYLCVKSVKCYGSEVMGCKLVFGKRGDFAKLRSQHKEDL